MDYKTLSSWLFAPADAYNAQAPKAPQSMGVMGQIHNAIDPVQAFGGYGGLMAMALPPGMTRAYHGTAAEIGEANPFTTSRKYLKKVRTPIYLSNSGEEASKFATARANERNKGMGARVMPLDVDTKDFPVINYADHTPDGKPLYDAKSLSDLALRLDEKGHPGAIIKGIQNFEGGPISDTYLVFDPSRIK